MRPRSRPHSTRPSGWTPDLLNPDGSTTEVADALSDGIIIRRYLSSFSPDSQTQWDGPDLTENALIPNDPSPAQSLAGRLEHAGIVHPADPFADNRRRLRPRPDRMPTVSQPRPDRLRQDEARSGQAGKRSGATAASAESTSVAAPAVTPAVSAANGPLVAPETDQAQPVEAASPAAAGPSRPWPRPGPADGRSRSVRSRCGRRWATGLGSTDEPRHAGCHARCFRSGQEAAGRTSDRSITAGESGRAGYGRPAGTAPRSGREGGRRGCAGG